MCVALLDNVIIKVGCVSLNVYLCFGVGSFIHIFVALYTHYM